MTARGSYRSDHAEAVAAIRSRREALGISINRLADRAGMHRDTLMRILATGLGFQRQINALRMALRSLEKERRAADALFPSAGDDQ